MKPLRAEDFAVTRNACKLCTPLGAVVAAAGFEGTMTLLHGSQGCATYIRRYLISHFREPLDVASSSFTEHSAVFGGRDQLVRAVENLETQYHPSFILVATTCLAETIGEDMGAHADLALTVMRARVEEGSAATLPMIATVSTAAYRGTHREGFQAAVLAVVKACVEAHEPRRKGFGLPSWHDRPVRMGVFPSMVSPADLRWLKDTLGYYHMDAVVVPDWSDTLDGGLWNDWHALPPGGTGLARVASLGEADVSLELGRVQGASAAQWLEEEHAVTRRVLELPVGIGQTDRFFDCLCELTGMAMPPAAWQARQRLADSYVDAHKYVADVPVLVYGEVDLVVALAVWLEEMGMVPRICATGARSAELADRIRAALPAWGSHGEQALDEADFLDIEAAAREAGVRLVLGSSKGFKAARALQVPHVRLGFPIHDRYGGQRIRMLGYEGAQILFDQVVNALIMQRQEGDDVGYTYF